MRRSIIVLVVLAACACTAAAAAETNPVGLTNKVVSTPSTGGGYPVPAGWNRACPRHVRPGELQLATTRSRGSRSGPAPRTSSAPRSSSSTSTRPSTSSTTAHTTIPDGCRPATTRSRATTCTTVGTQEMPPSWTERHRSRTSRSTPRAAPTRTMLPFNAFWRRSSTRTARSTISYSDDLGRHWVKGNGGQPLEQSPNSTRAHPGTSRTSSGSQSTASPTTASQDHVYAAWAVFNGNGRSRCGWPSRATAARRFTKAVTMSAAVTGRHRRHVRLPVDRRRWERLRLRRRRFPPNRQARRLIYVARSTDDGRTFGALRPRSPRRWTLPTADACRTPSSATASSRASPPARPTPATST